MAEMALAVYFAIPIVVLAVFTTMQFIRGVPLWAGSDAHLVPVLLPLLIVLWPIVMTMYAWDEFADWWSGRSYIKQEEQSWPSNVIDR